MILNETASVAVHQVTDSNAHNRNSVDKCVQEGVAVRVEAGAGEEEAIEKD